VQIAFFCVSALAGGTMFYRWRRMEEEDRARVWRLYGWVSGLMAFGSCVGAVAWAARMMQLVSSFKANSSSDLVKQSSLFALSFSWRSAFTVTYAVEFMCMSAAKLMVLDRMSVLVAPQGPRMLKLWVAAGRGVMAVVVLGNAVGLAANIAAAVHYQKASEAENSASTYYAASNIDDGKNSSLVSQREARLAGSISSVQLFCEVAVLLLIVFAFAVVGVLSARRVSVALREVEKLRVIATFNNPGQVVSPIYADATTQGKAMLLKMAGTTAFVFLTFVARSAFSTLFAISYQFSNFGNAICSKGPLAACDASCYNVYTHIVTWMFYTPEFQLTILLISSPLALLFALWRMTPKATLQLMKSSQKETLVAPRAVKSTIPLNEPL
jgi:hypothetical protein